MGAFLVEWYTDVYLHTYGIDTTYTDIVLKFNSYLKRILENDSFDVLGNTIWLIGFCMMLIFFAVDMSDKAAAKQLTFLQVGKAVSLLLVSIYLSFHTREIFITILNLVEWLNDFVSRSWKTGNEGITFFLENDAIQTLLTRSVDGYFTLWEAIGYTLHGIIIYLVALATKAVVIYLSAMRVIELFAYSVYAPIGIADMFEHGPGGIINTASSGFRYIKKMMSMALQVVVITIICQSFSFVSTAINSDYFNTPTVDIPIIGDIVDFAADTISLASAVYPLNTFEYTDEAGIKVPIVWEWKRLYSSSGDELDKPKEVKKATEVVNLSGEIVNKKEHDKIIENEGVMKNYHMTVKSTERFFDWCIGTSGGKIILLVILMVTKALLVLTSARLCDSIMGVR